MAKKAEKKKVKKQSGVTKRKKPSTRSNIYTVLALVTLSVLLTGVIYVWVRSVTLFGNSNPFDVTPPSAGWISF